MLFGRSILNNKSQISVNYLHLAQVTDELLRDRARYFSFHMGHIGLVVESRYANRINATFHLALYSALPFGTCNKAFFLKANKVRKSEKYT